MIERKPIFEHPFYFKFISFSFILLRFLTNFIHKNLNKTGALNKFSFINNLLFVHSSELHETVMECKWHEKNVDI